MPLDSDDYSLDERILIHKAFKKEADN